MIDLNRHAHWGPPLGIDKRARPFWLGRGASEPGGEGDATAQGGGSGDGTTGQGAGTASTTDQTATDTGQSAGKDDADKVGRAEFERIQNQLRTADQKRQEAETRLKEIEDSKKDELTKATERAEELSKQLAAKDTELQQLKLERAMLVDAEFGADKWQDPEEILDKVQRAVRDEQITMKDGEPDPASVKTFLKDLASKKSYLLKGKEDGKGGSDGKNGPSGKNVGGGDRRTSDQEKTDQELRARYRIR